MNVLHSLNPSDNTCTKPRRAELVDRYLCNDMHSIMIFAIALVSKIMYYTCITHLVFFLFLLSDIVMVEESSPWINLLPAKWQRALAAYFFPVRLSPERFEDDVTFSAVKTIYTCKTESDMLSTIMENPHSPLLFKQAFSPSQVEKKIDVLREMTAGKKYRFLDMSSKEFGSLLVESLVNTLWGRNLMRTTDPTDPTTYTADISRVTFESKLDGIFDGSRVDAYAAFVPVGYGKLGEIFNFRGRRCLLDFSFFGNLSRKAVTASFHSHWASDTLAIQLAGYKQWLVASPHDMKIIMKEQNFRMCASGKGPVLYPGLKITPSLVDKLRVATTEPGDCLYLPPYSPHCVITSPGLNIMSGINFVDSASLTKAFSLHPSWSLQAASDVLFSRISRILKSTLRGGAAFRNALSQKIIPDSFDGIDEDPFFSQVLISSQGLAPCNDAAFEKALSEHNPSSEKTD